MERLLNSVIDSKIIFCLLVTHTWKMFDSYAKHSQTWRKFCKIASNKPAEGYFEA